MATSLSYRAPFAPGGTAPVDAEVCRKLLTIALSRGGDYADLFFEYRAGGGLSFEEGITRSASRGVSMGLGVRVQKGDATGYAHVEDLSWEAMKRAASDAILAAGGTITHRHAVGRDHRDWYDVQRPDLFAAALRAAKCAVDPAGVLNPGVLVDAPGP